MQKAFAGIGIEGAVVALQIHQSSSDLDYCKVLAEVQQESAGFVLEFRERMGKHDCLEELLDDYVFALFLRDRPLTIRNLKIGGIDLVPPCDQILGLESQ
ncbi:hypothetical protein HG530_008973 [Fusarium avenaceum]|nr:hypothetical protein HG530_008973 [Fusarium avenaceum]